jgi:hypothetical protein
LRHLFQIPFKPDHIQFRIVSAPEILRNEYSHVEN